jgi:hypothetical protein
LTAPASEKLGLWQRAQGWYQKSHASYVDLQKRGVLQAEDTRYLDESVAGLARCNAELVKPATRDPK